MNRIRFSAAAVALTAAAFAFTASSAVAAPAPTTSTALSPLAGVMGNTGQALHPLTTDGADDSGWGGR